MSHLIIYDDAKNKEVKPFAFQIKDNGIKPYFPFVLTL